ncbi:GNAT family N-acetyltransferase [Thalassospira sp.]|uniref:GNAT family N-acetyltransferase n=1 Tax=Thalassospira sp. TaxID=1912094 RepID=UPI002734479F|nr:GNAT family N-acetyltransferase [Thalassospira sp.]MDP2700006.1 GNAT family N-acetyltransferase [Thalassospira sp.]
MSPSEYELIVETPTVADYCRLRRDTGLSPKTEQAATIGLAASLYAVQIRHNREIVGMGRVVGDGGCFFQIVDMAVDPAHQGKGLGKRIMTALIDWLTIHAPQSAYISLIADGDARYLYAQFGFAPTTPKSIGMYLKRTGA